MLLNKNSKVHKPLGKAEFIHLAETVHVQRPAGWIRNGSHTVTTRMAALSWSDPDPLIREPSFPLSNDHNSGGSKTTTLISVKRTLNSVPSINAALVHRKTRRFLQLGNGLHRTEGTTVASTSGQQRRTELKTESPGASPPTRGHRARSSGQPEGGSGTADALRHVRLWLFSHRPTEKAAS